MVGVVQEFNDGPNEDDVDALLPSGSGPEPESEPIVVLREHPNRVVTVEPMLFFALFGIGAMVVTVQSFIITLICMRKNEEANGSFVDSCDNLTEYKDKGLGIMNHDHES
jgi:hypothetical protein